jgi:hypothetical protein
MNRVSVMTLEDYLQFMAQHTVTINYRNMQHTVALVITALSHLPNLDIMSYRDKQECL